MSNRKHRYIWTGFALVLAMLICAPAAPAAAQMSASLEKEPGEWNRIFPLFGKRLAEKGYRLPKPAGLSPTYFWAKQRLRLDQLRFAINDGEMIDADFVKFGDSTVASPVGSLRFDLWLFPFLNIYAFGAGTKPSSEIVLDKPIELRAQVDSIGGGGGMGAVLAFGFRGIWFTLDGNLAWSKTNSVDKPVRSQVLGLRTGHTLRFAQERTFSYWGGAQVMWLDARTAGTVKLAEVLPGDQIDGIIERLEDACAGLPPGPRARCLEAVTQLADRGSNATVSYEIDKGFADPWTAVIGAQYGFNEDWFFRAEFGFPARLSLLASINWRFGIR